MNDRQDLVTIAVYFNPSDYPGKYVACRFLVTRDGLVRDDEPLVGDTLEFVRSYIPQDMVRLHRDPSDDPSILETWI